MTNEHGPGSALERQPSARELARRALVVTPVALGVLAALLLFWKASNVVLILFGATLFAIFLHTTADWIARRSRMNRKFALATTLVLLIGLVTVGGYFVAPRVAGQFDELSRTIPRSVDQLTASLRNYDWGRWVLERAPDAKQILTPSAAAQRAGRFFSSLFGGITAVVVVLFAGLFMATTPGVYRGGFLRLIPPKGRDRADEILVALESTLAWWLLGRFMSMAVVGIMTWIGLMLLDVPLALTLGLIAGLLSFIPYVGPVLSAIPAILLGLTVDPAKAWHVAILYIVIQLVESNLITPLIEKKTVWLAPALAITAQLLAGLLFGPLGVVLATPLAATLLVLVKTLYLEDLLGESVEVSRAT